MKRAEQLGAVVDWRSRAVLRRNAQVYFRNWKTAFVPPALEPLVYFLAFGLGLAGYVGTMTYGDRHIDYPTYVAPGLLAYTAFGTSFFEALYSAYVRMFYQKTWDGILATQVELPHLIWGEVLWAGVRGAMNTAIVAVVLGVLNAAGVIDLHWPWLLLAPFLALPLGWAVASVALIFTANVPSIDHMNYPVFLIGVPVGLVSNTFFPLDPQSWWLRRLLDLDPVYHLAETYRSLLVGEDPTRPVTGLLVVCTLYLVPCVLWVMRLMRRRMLSD
jgi:lipooligosaccharide transport system permease protein